MCFNTEKTKQPGMRVAILLLTLLTSFQIAYTQPPPVVIYLAPTDSLITFQHPMGEVMFTHTVTLGQTLFSLAKFYGLTLQELYAYNPRASEHYELGDKLVIPIPLKAIIRQVPPPAMLPNLAPVFYQVKPGDTVFGLCNRVFEVPNEWLQTQNPALASGLKPGQLLRIGWISTAGIPAEWREIRGGPYARINYPYKLAFFQRSAEKKISEERGAATWPKDMDQNTGFFCLHRSAPINSLVEVYNPLTHQTMYLKVSERLPERVYDRNTLVVVSPLAAKALGARDNRFYVHLKHY